MTTSIGRVGSQNGLRSFYAVKIVALILLVGVAGCGRERGNRLAQFEERAKRLVDPTALQSWATNRIAAVKQIGDVGINPNEAPVSIRTVYNDNPEMIWTHKDQSNQNSYVEIVFGSGFGHWGLIVGTASFVIASTKTREIVPWKPGIFFFDSY